MRELEPARLEDLDDLVRHLKAGLVERLDALARLVRFPWEVEPITERERADRMAVVSRSLPPEFRPVTLDDPTDPMSVVRHTRAADEMIAAIREIEETTPW